MIPSWFPLREIPELKKYENFHLISEGGFGEIYSASLVTKQISIPVVVKRLKPVFVTDPKEVSSFENDAHFLKKLNHPQIPKYYDGYVSPEECFFIMEYVPGDSLYTLIHRAKVSGLKFPLELALKVIIDICPILGYLHSYKEQNGEQNPVFHCDIKPKNILITPEIKIYLIDFSVATQLEINRKFRGGTYYYMPPELIAGEKPSSQTDLFALMLTLWNTLTLQKSIQRKPLVQIFGDLLSEKHLKAIRSQGLPPSLENLLLKGLSFKPESRYQNAAELLTALQGCVDDLKLNLSVAQLKEKYSRLSKVS